MNASPRDQATYDQFFSCLHFYYLSIHPTAGLGLLPPSDAFIHMLDGVCPPNQLSGSLPPSTVSPTAALAFLLWGHSHMMSAKFSEFLIPDLVTDTHIQHISVIVLCVDILCECPHPFPLGNSLSLFQASQFGLPPPQQAPPPSFLKASMHHAARCCSRNNERVSRS